MKVARSVKEFVTFGIIVAGKKVIFTSLKLSDDGKYTYLQHGEVCLPTFRSTTGDMEAFLKSFLSFKEMMKDSLASEGEKRSTNLFDRYSHLIKPTIALKQEKESTKCIFRLPKQITVYNFLIPLKNMWILQLRIQQYHLLRSANVLTSTTSKQIFFH